MVIFSKGEFTRRLRDAQQLMKKKKIDGLFLTMAENYHYFTGGSQMTFHSSNARPVGVVVPAEGEIIAVVSGTAESWLRDEAAIKDIRVYSSVFGVPNDMLLGAFKDAGLKKGTVGAEFGLECEIEMPYNDFTTLRESLPAVRFVDGSDVIWGLRMYKSKEELALMREACRVTGKARQRCFSEVEVGMTQREIAQIYSTLMHKEGADRIAFMHIITDPNYAVGYFYSPTRKLRNGEILSIDAGAYIYSYACDYPRLAVAGKPSDKQKKAYASLLRINKKMKEAIKPGGKCSDVFRAGVQATRDEGFASHVGAGRMGHGQGQLITEPPSVAESDDTVLDPGLVVSTEPGYLLDYGCFVWEDVHVVTEDGCETLSTETDELFLMT